MANCVSAMTLLLYKFIFCGLTSTLTESRYPDRKPYLIGVNPHSLGMISAFGNIDNLA